MNIKKRPITSFISSVNRVSNEYTYNFTIDYPDGILSCEQEEYIELNVYRLTCSIRCVTRG
jgi:hypothetical protein